MASISYHVVPTGRGGWCVRRSGTVRAASLHERKAQAESAGMVLAHATGAPLYIHRRDGMVQRVRRA